MLNDSCLCRVNGCLAISSVDYIILHRPIFEHVHLTHHIANLCFSDSAVISTDTDAISGFELGISCPIGYCVNYYNAYIIYPISLMHVQLKESSALGRWYTLA